MNHAAAKTEELLTRIAVTAVLFHRILHRLFGEAVLQFEGRNRQAIDENSEIERALCLVLAVA